MSRLIKHYRQLIDDPRACLKQFSWSTVLFFFGLVLVVGSDVYLQDSVEQELTRLAGLVIAAPAFLIAISAYLCFIISRFRNL